MAMDFKTAPRAWAEIDVEALLHNFNMLKNRCGKKVMCVIKGDAHGHGAVRCGQALEKAGADAFAVACLPEAIALREGGITKPLLVLGWTPPEMAPTMVQYGLTQSVIEEAYAQQLEEAAAPTGGTLSVHIKLDTGMSRTGFFAQENHQQVAEAICRVQALPHLQITGIFTHFAVADVPEKDDFTAWQLSNYNAVLAELAKLGFDQPVLRHTGNSAGILYHPECYFDMVRAGVALYGLYPTNVNEPNGPLSPVLTLKARVAQVKQLPAGAHISYGCTFETPHPMSIAVITAGYADSYPRSLSGKGAYAVINGKRCPQVGRICMDMCMFDVTGVDVASGDEVILYGKGGMSLEEITNLAGTINCEPTCLLTNRVARIYIGE